MSNQASFTVRNRNPDVLTCIANLSSDEVFTPPEFANKMLDLLADSWASSHADANIWSDPNVKFLDPCTKSGVFLREITKRLSEGLSTKIPDLEERVDHILTNQVYGIGITYLTSLLARRSVYCSKNANGKHSIAKSLDNEHGNIWFERQYHTWNEDRCDFCGASKSIFDRNQGLETHAYAFIHNVNPNELITKIFGENMQFDVIIGNPPYQLNDGGHGSSAAPIYQMFVEKALQLNPRFLIMVTPSRWMAGGKGLDKYRERMLSDKRIQSIVDFPKLYEAFPGVKIRGGVSYFLWNREYHGPCEFQTIWDGQPTGPAKKRFLDAYDVLVRRNEALSILEKVRAKNESTLNLQVSSRKPFGLSTNFKGKPSKTGLKNAVKLYENQRIGWIERTAIEINLQWIDRWKVLITRVQGTSSAVETKFLGKPLIAEPGTACTETYLVAGHFDSREEAAYYAQYLRTRFVRFLVSLRKPSVDAARGVYGFVPTLPLDREWSDAKLYKRYGLTKEEISYIESQVAEHDDEADDSAEQNEDE